MTKENSQTRIKKIMDDRGLRQVDILNLSEPWQKKLGVTLSKNALSQYVNGISTPDNHKAVLLAKTLGVTEPWLLGFDVPMISDNASLIIEETIKVLEKLEEARQKIVLEAANEQLKYQEAEKETSSNLISLKNKASELTDEEFEQALDDAVRQTVAFDGKPLDERERAIAKQMLRDAWEEDNGKR